MVKRGVYRDDAAGEAGGAELLGGLLGVVVVRDRDVAGRVSSEP